MKTKYKFKKECAMRYSTQTNFNQGKAVGASVALKEGYGTPLHQLTLPPM